VLAKRINSTTRSLALISILVLFVETTTPEIDPETYNYSVEEVSSAHAICFLETMYRRF